MTYTAMATGGEAASGPRSTPDPSSPDPGSEPRPDLPRDRVRRPRPSPAARIAAFLLVGGLAFSCYATAVPETYRCSWPGAVGCPGGVLGATLPGANATYEQWFNISMYDYGFWVTDTTTGANETKSWNVYEGWTVHVNATSLRADPSVGGTAYHGIGVELNATGKQLFSIAAGVGKWNAGSFVAPTHAYYRQHVWCTIYCGNGHDGMQSHPLNIVPSTLVPTVAASATPTSGGAPLAVALVGKVTGGTSPFAYAWDFGDGSTGATTLDANHTYGQSGTYSAVLSVTDAAGFKGSGSIGITVRSAATLNATAAASPAAGVVPFEATLSGRAAGGVAPFAYAWTFGDGATGTGASVGHLYTSAGQFSVSLTVTDAAGTRSTAVTTVAAEGASGSFPVSITASSLNGSAPLPVNLTAVPSGGTGPYLGLWILGDGNVSAGLSTAHTYSSPGVYSASAFVTDSSRRVGKATVEVTVSGSGGGALRGWLTEVPSAGSPPLAVDLAVSEAGGTAPYGLPTWQLGDGSNASGLSVSHAYTALGQFPVSVRVTDARSGAVTLTGSVRVEGFHLNITLNRTDGDAPLSLGAAATILGGTGSYGSVTWTWGDGTSGTGNPLNHTFPRNRTGPVTIVASVTDSSGASASANATVVIHPDPTANVSARLPPGAYAPVSVDFTLVVSGGTGRYDTLPLWLFGDGTTTRGPAAENHTYVRPGRYHVTVRTNDSLGVVANASLWFTVPGGAAAGGPAGPPTWTFNGLGNANTAALGLLGIVSLSGLIVLGAQVLRRPAVSVAVLPGSSTAAGAPFARTGGGASPPRRRSPP